MAINPHSKSNPEYKAGYNAGVKIACALSGITTEDAIRKSAFVDAALRKVETQKFICKIASVAFSEAGMRGSAEHALYEVIGSKNTLLEPSCTERFIVPVIKSLAKQASVAYEEDMTKSAAQMLAGGALSNIVGKTTATTPEVMRLLATIGVGAGGAAGALTWALNRDSTQDDADTEAKQRQATHYRQIASDIKKRLQLDRDRSATTRSIKNSVDDDNSGMYVV